MNVTEDVQREFFSGWSNSRHHEWDFKTNSTSWQDGDELEITGPVDLITSYKEKITINRFVDMVTLLQDIIESSNPSFHRKMYVRDNDLHGWNAVEISTDAFGNTKIGKKKPRPDMDLMVIFSFGRNGKKREIAFRTTEKGYIEALVIIPDRLKTNSSFRAAVRYNSVNFPDLSEFGRFLVHTAGVGAEDTYQEWKERFNH